MSFLKRVKNLFTKKTDNMVMFDAKCIPESDIGCLAMMCRLAEPKLQKNKVSPFVYAYYVPNDEKYLNLAKNIFAKNNIVMHRHFSKIVSEEGMNILRTNYIRYNNPTLVEDNMERIRRKHVELFQPGTSKERRFYASQIEKMLAKAQELQK